MTRWRGATAALAAVLLLAGCATIPVAGPVETAPAQVQQADPGFGFQPASPTDGASPEAIVRGFIQASSAGGDYAVAKEFLTTEFARSWPHDRVLVHTASWETKTLAGDRVQLRIPISARVDTDGVYTPSPDTVTKDYELVQVRGQWRIADGPDEVVLAQRAFLGVYNPAYLQFFDAGYKRFVPDLRWFPARANRPAKTISALLAGQARPLRDVTLTAFPAAATLADPVRTSDGQISVDLQVPGARPDEQRTNRMQQQLTASLRGSGAGSGSVRLSVNGRTAAAAPELELEQLSVTGPVGVSGGKFGAITVTGTVREDRALGPRIVQLKPTAITYSARQNLAAVQIGGGAIAVVSRTGDPRLVDQRDGLLPPTLDQSGWTYSVPAAQPTEMWAFDAQGRRVDMTADLGGTVVRSIEVSTDGTRMLVLHDTDAGPEAYVAGIERDANGQPIGLTSDRYPVALGVDGALDATWIDQSSVAVLVAATASLQNVIVQQLGGTSDTLGSLSNAREVVGATRVEDLRALLGTGAILRPDSDSDTWTQEFGAAIKVDVLAVQR